jgi:hypothetical protein
MNIIENIYKKPVMSGAALSKSDAPKLYFITFLGIPFLFVLFFYIAATEQYDDFWPNFLSWTFVVFLFYLFTVGIAAVYGHRRREQIDVTGAHRVDFGLANRVAIFVAATMPLFKMLLDWLGLG